MSVLSLEDGCSANLTCKGVKLSTPSGVSVFQVHTKDENQVALSVSKSRYLGAEADGSLAVRKTVVDPFSSRFLTWQVSVRNHGDTESSVIVLRNAALKRVLSVTDGGSVGVTDVAESSDTCHWTVNTCDPVTPLSPESMSPSTSEHGQVPPLSPATDSTDQKHGWALLRSHLRQAVLRCLRQQLHEQQQCTREARRKLANYDDADTECVVCWDLPQNCALLPCGHACTCIECAATMEQCPTCRTPIQERLRLHNPQDATVRNPAQFTRPSCIN
ncbi:MAG: hypothetical protein MHM6MM_001348 [Cercozoa sp. M6MM]